MENIDQQENTAVEKPPLSQTLQKNYEEKLPKTLFILPMRNGVLFPGVLSPLTVTSESDLETVRAAERRGEIGLVLLKENLEEDENSKRDSGKEMSEKVGKLWEKDDDASRKEKAQYIERIEKQMFTEDDHEEQLAQMIKLFSNTESVRDAEKFHKIGVYAKIIKKIKLPNGGVSLFLTIIRRFSIKRFFSTGDLFIASVGFFENEFIMGKDTSKAMVTAYTRLLNKEIRTISSLSPVFSDEVKVNIANIENPGRLADYIANNLDITPEEQQSILETIDVKTRIEKVLHFLEKEKSIIEIQARIENQVKGSFDKRQREFFLREEMKSIQDELNGRYPSPGFGQKNEGEIPGDKASKLARKAKSLPLNAEAKETVETELGRLSQTDPMMHEYTLILNYLETLLSLPWKDPKPEKIEIKPARKILDNDHYGLEDVKERIMEFIAVRKLKNDTKGSIICLVGPPGVGKTSVGLSVARALRKKCFRFSVGGIRDEAEIKGHRRTYIGALPGKIIQGLRITKTKDPVFLIDEIDKLQSGGVQGDPAAAMLEVLDPEQNSTFRDHFLDVPFDISQILFIVTANETSHIPRPLLDRMEVIELAGYTSQEKLQIAKHYLVPKARKANGIKASDVYVSDKMLSYIAEGWAREPGVRNLEKALNKIFRKIALESFMNEDFKRPVRITMSNIKHYLDSPIYSEDDIIRADKIGMSIGLAYNGFGGTTLAIEAISIPKDKEGIKLTGQLGDVMKESANIAFSLLESEASELGLDPTWFEKNNVHIHFPDGATPKDGPSAGAAICCALYSLVSQKLICPDLAMTGELSLTGRVMAIGGLKEKTLAVARNKFTHVIIPKTNKKDLDKLDSCVKEGLTFHLVSDIRQVLKIAFSGTGKPGTADGVQVFSYLEEPKKKAPAHKTNQKGA